MYGPFIQREEEEVNHTADNSDATSATIVGALAREQIQRRLDRALRIARGDLGEDLGELRTVLRGVLERVDALDLPRATLERDAGTSTDVAQPISCLAAHALADNDRGPACEFLLIPFGEVEVERPVSGDSFVFTRTHAESAKRWFDRIGRKLAIDYEHQSFERLNRRADGLRPAAGWIGGLAVREDGLWAVDVTWTERATTLLRSGEYRYFSPVIYWTDEDQTDVAALGPVALTNDPAMHNVRPLAAGRAREHTTDADGDDTTEDTTRLTSALEEARRETHLLRRQLAAQEADTFVERGLRLGKVVDATSADWRDDYLRDPQGAEERLTRAPVLLPPGRVTAPPRRPHGAPRAANHATALAIENEDLEAYARAAADGRICSSGGLAQS